MEKKVSKKQQACVNRYISNHYDRITITAFKGKKAIIAEHAERHGESVNAYINRAIDKALQEDDLI